MLSYALIVISATLGVYEILTPLRLSSFIQHMQAFVFVHGGPIIFGLRTVTSRIVSKSAG